MIMGVLYFAREILVPLALAVLLSFALAPLVRMMRDVGVPRVFSVLLAVVAAFTLLFVLGWLITAQVSELVRDLPQYQTTVQRKIASLKGATATSGALEQVSVFLNTVSAELETADERAPPAQSAPTADPKPVPVTVLEPSPGAFSTLAALLRPLIHPFAMTGIVIIFVIFILMQREDLRNRFIKLVGTRDLQKTTAAIDDAARRLSRLLLIQLAMNSMFGVVIGVGLWAIGIPIPILWGILSAVLRFVPYIGAFISAALPLALAAAVDPGWTMLAWTAALFFITEPIVGHFVEPLAYGRTTGLSPVAVVVAATFWTWLWGPIGLLLATPLTVCLVVLGRHVKGLSFLEVLLGDRPALSPPELFYQRALARDSVEMIGVAEQILKERSLSEYYDQIAVPGLRLAAEDAERGLVGDERSARIRETVEEVVDDLEVYDDIQPERTRTVDPEAEAAVESTADRAEVRVVAPDRLRPEWAGEAPVLAIGAENEIDHAAAIMLRQLVAKHGIGTRAEGPDALSARRIFQVGGRDTRVVCLIALSTTHEIQLRRSVRRVRRRLPGTEILLVTPGIANPGIAQAIGADANVSSFHEVLERVVAAAEAPEAAVPEPETPPAAELA